jgi:microcystin-dependent protein
MAGSIGLSLAQLLDKDSLVPLDGGKIYFYEAGTVADPQNAYQDYALTIPWPNPITLDSGGNVPQIFFADGFIKFRITNALGVAQREVDNVLVIGPSSGSGSGGAVDATTVLATGDIKTRYGTGSLSGFARLNGRTIGSATSGASERANADCQALFEFLWGVDANLSVSTGRGVSANADWTANKTIALPDARGRVLASLDDMGNSAAGRLTSTYFGATATTLGASGGAESHTLSTAEIPSHSHTLTDPGHKHALGENTGTNMQLGSGNRALGVVNPGVDGQTNAGFTNTNTTGITLASTGGGGAHAIVQPTLLITNYIKL